MSIMVLNPGLLTTVQDMGRVGYQQFGSKGHSEGDDNQQCPADKGIEHHICDGVF